MSGSDESGIEDEAALAEYMTRHFGVQPPEEATTQSAAPSRPDLHAGPRTDPGDDDAVVDEWLARYFRRSP